MKKSAESPYELWDATKRSNSHIMEVLREGREKGAGSLFKNIMAENFPDL